MRFFGINFPRKADSKSFHKNAFFPLFKISSFKDKSICFNMKYIIMNEFLILAIDSFSEIIFIIEK